MKTWIKNIFWEMLQALFVAVLIPATFSCTALTIFLANSAEIAGTVPTLLPPLCLIIGVGTLFLFLVQLPFVFVKKSWMAGINAFLLGCGFLLWLQSNVFNWNFGKLDGSGINWSAYRHLMILELIAYLAIIAFVLWQRHRFSKYAIHIVCILIFMQVAPLARPVMRELLSMRTKVAVKHLLGIQTTPEMYAIALDEITPKPPEAEPVLDPTIPSWKQYEITYDKLFDYSQKQNVVLIVTDAYSTELFQRMMEKHPDVAGWFSDFNYFPQQKSQGGTNVSIPQMLTACDFDFVLQGADRGFSPEEYNAKLISLWNSEGALQKKLTEAGFQTMLDAWAPTVYHWDHRWISNIRLKNTTSDSSRSRTRRNIFTESNIGNLIDLALLRSVPIVCKPSAPDQFHPVQQFLQAAETKPREYIPLPEGHRDFFFVQKMIENPPSATNDIPTFKMFHLSGAHRPYSFNENFKMEKMDGIEGEERQAYAVLLLLKRLIDDMKQLDVYDRAIIVIAGDHGNFPDGITTISNMAQFYNPLLLIKRQNERHESIVWRTEYTNVQDMTPTILDLVGEKLQPGTFSIFKIPSDVLDQRKTEYESFWAKQRQNPKWQVVKIVKSIGDSPVISSNIVLKRARLFFKNNQLQWYVGDDPDVWDKTSSRKEAIITLNPTNKQLILNYHGPAQLHMNDTGGHKWTNFWSCAGVIDVTNVADGDYEAAFLLPQNDGTFARCSIPGMITIASGTTLKVTE